MAGTGPSTALRIFARLATIAKSDPVVLPGLQQELSIIFPRHHGSPDLSNDDLDSFAEHVFEPVLSMLKFIVVLEISLSSGDNAASLGRLDARQIAAEFVDALPRIRERVNFDIRASIMAKARLARV